MPNTPTRAAEVAAASPASPTSPTTFHDILPAHLIAGAPPPEEPPRRRVTSKGSPAKPLQRSQTTPGRDSSQRSLWGVVRGATVRMKMRDVVESVTRRPSDRSEQGKDARYMRLNGDASASRHGKHPSV
jgi:hypothetical protein